MSGLYQLQQLGFDYGTSFTLSNISLDIEKGSITSFVGPNGSGKSSLLNLLAFLELPGQGTLHYKQQLLEKNRQTEFKKTVAYVQQNPYLLRGNVLQNVELGLKLQHVDKAQRIKRVNDIMQLINISALSQRNVHELSGGEAQKVAIARVLVLDPEVLILDEPFTFLDKRSIQELEELISRLKQEFGKTIILTTHNQLQAQTLSDKVYSVVQGKIFESQFINLFFGKMLSTGNQFDTGKLVINLPDGDASVTQIAIDPKQIVLSREKLDSSMQNSFCGIIKAMIDQEEQVKLVVSAGETFDVIITHQALQELGLLIGNEVWISFKSSSILIC